MLLIAILAVVSVASLSYYVLSQPNENQDNPSLTPTPSPSEKPTEPASIPTPSVPEFTLKYVDNSYDVPSSTTTTTDPYTGEQTITTEPGYHVANETIEVTIKKSRIHAIFN